MSNASNPDRSPLGEPMSDWGPTASLSALSRRSELLRQLRGFFDDRGFLEVETPVLSRDTVIDRHLEPLRVPATIDGSSNLPTDAFLQTSPEFHMKRLLAAGAQSIYQVTRAFRSGEIGPLHNIEFTMVEWYRVGDTMDEAIQRLADLAGELLDRRPVTTRYRELFLEHVGLDPHTATEDEFAAAAQRLEVLTPPSMLGDEVRRGKECQTGDEAAEARLDDWRCLLLTECVEPKLKDQALVVIDYPASQAALARVAPDEDGTPVAKRFELYVDGVELANGYDELLDAKELRHRNQRVNAQRVADGNASLPVESRLLAPPWNRGCPLAAVWLSASTDWCCAPRAPKRSGKQPRFPGLAVRPSQARDRGAGQRRWETHGAS